MIIGIDVNTANLKNRSGVGGYVSSIVQEFKRLSQLPQYEHLAFRLYSSAPLKGELAELPARWESRHLRWVNLPFWNLWTQLRLSWELLVHPPNIFFAPGYTLPVIHPKNSFSVIHDIAYLHYPEYYSKFIAWYYTKITPYTLRSSKAIITPSQYTKDDIVKYLRFPPDKIKIIPLAYDPRFDQSAIDAQSISAIREQYRLKDPYVIFIGRLQAKKNILGLIQAYESLKTKMSQPPSLVLAGSSDFGWDQTQAYIAQKGLSQDVKWLGYVASNSLPALLAGAQAFVFPSLYEGFGIPVLESMAAGVPVIASNTTSLPEVAGNAALLVNPHDSKHIAQALKIVLTDEAQKKALIAKGFERAKQFSWTKTAQATLDFLLQS